MYQIWEPGKTGCGDGVSWRREEGALEEFQSFIHQIYLVERQMDRRVWNVSDEGIYTVKSAFLLCKKPS